MPAHGSWKNRSRPRHTGFGPSATASRECFESLNPAARWPWSSGSSTPPGWSAFSKASQPGLTVGRVRLADRRDVFGVLAEPHLVDGQPEITAFGGWRAYLGSPV
jgi:hypothetical protein